MQRDTLDPFHPPPKKNTTWLLQLNKCMCVVIIISLTGMDPQLLRLIILLLIKQRRNISLTTQQHARCIQMHFLTNRFQQRNPHTHILPIFYFAAKTLKKKSKYQI